MRRLREAWIAHTKILLVILAMNTVVQVTTCLGDPTSFVTTITPPVVSEAKLVELASDPQWRALLHYDSLITAVSPRSRALPSGFFLSDVGFSDPRKELEATIQGIFAEQSLGDEHVQCRFPARTSWITKTLALRREQLPQVVCGRFERWYSAINPESVTLIFPTSFLNNPASAFGHTFLRFDQRGVSDNARLLDYAADFAASTEGATGIVYAVKGVIGGFNGYYSIAPFAKKVEKYSDFENRDIWEYRLQLSDEEVRLLAAHLWELREKPFTYYYFDENCSYHILTLLDVARPSLNLVQSMRSWIIPIDTIREVERHPQLIRSVVFRPSAATKLRARIDVSSSNARTAAIKIANTSDPIPDLVSRLDSVEERAAALDLGYDYLTYELIKRRDESSDDKRRLWNILAARSEMPPTEPIVARDPDVRPENGHKSAAISVGVGRSEDRAIGEVVFRPSFHTLSDPQGGYLFGNQIKFFETAVRYTERRGVELNRLNVIDIVALTPRDSFFQPISWRINLSYLQYQREGSEPLGLGNLSVGAGQTYSLGSRALVYGMLDGALEYSETLDRDHAVGLGPRGGLVLAPSDALSVDLFASRVNFFTGDSHAEFIGGVNQRVAIARDLSLGVDVTYTDAFQNPNWNWMLRLEGFFSP